MIVFLSIFIQSLKLLPHVLFLLAKDYFYYLKDKRWKLFEGWGLHIYVGSFGVGKTCSMIHDAYELAVKYPQLTIVTNLHLQNFPPLTQILPLNSPKDILEAPDNTLVLIDEIGTIFNSRDFSKGKESIPKILFQHICQCRKRRMMIYATSQRWTFVDKQLRDITATVRLCRIHLAHPFSRLGTVRVFDSYDYDLLYNNPVLPIQAYYGYAYVQTDKIRSLYSTEELIENLLKADYVSDKEIMENRGETPPSFTEVDKKGQRTAKRNNNYRS